MSTKHAMEMLRGIGPLLGKIDHRPAAVPEVVRGLIAERAFDAARRLDWYSPHCLDSAVAIGTQCVLRFLRL